MNLLCMYSYHSGIEKITHFHLINFFLSQQFRAINFTHFTEALYVETFIELRHFNELTLRMVISSGPFGTNFIIIFFKK